MIWLKKVPNNTRPIAGNQSTWKKVLCLYDADSALGAYHDGMSLAMPKAAAASLVTKNWLQSRPEKGIAMAAPAIQ